MQINREIIKRAQQRLNIVTTRERNIVRVRLAYKFDPLDNRIDVSELHELLHVNEMIKSTRHRNGSVKPLQEVKVVVELHSVAPM